MRVSSVHVRAWPPVSTGAETIPEGTIVFSHGPDSSGTIPKVIDKFNKENRDGLTALYRQAPADSGQYFDKLRTNSKREVPPRMSSAVTSSGLHSSVPTIGFWICRIASPTKCEASSWNRPLETNTFDGKIYGVPWFTDVGMLYYRPIFWRKLAWTLLPKHGTNVWRWPRRSRRRQGTQYGFLFQGAEYEGGVVNGLEFVYNAGAEVMPAGDPTTIVIDQGGADKGLAMQQRLVAEGVAPEAVATWKELETQDAFIKGNAVFMRSWPFVYGTILGGKATGSELKPEQVGIAPIPILEDGDESFSGQGGWNFFINANTKKADDCFKFIEYMIQPEIQAEFAVGASFLPPRTSLYEDEDLLKEQPVIELAKDLVTRAKPRPRHPFYSDMSLVMANEFNSVTKSDSTPNDAVSTLQSELERFASLGAEVYDL